MTDVPGDISSIATFEGTAAVGSFSGQFEFGGDRDFIRVDLIAGLTYLFFASALTVGRNDTGDSALGLRNAAGALILENDNQSATNDNSFISFAPVQSGTFFIEVTDLDDPGVSYYTVFMQALSAVPTFLTSFNDNHIGAAADVVIVGQEGNDDITFHATATVTALGEQGNDELRSNKASFMSGGVGQDDLSGSDVTDFLFGDWGDDFLDGNSGDDKLWGGPGNDILNGDPGIDEMHGGDGDDIYSVRDLGDQVIEESALGGIDTVVSDESWTLGPNVENLVLTGGADNGTGNELANNITGNNDDNVLLGLGGNDVLSGRDDNDILDGGAGADYMEGGFGNDQFFVDNAGDVTIDQALVGGGGGIDRVSTSVSYTIPTISEIEIFSTTDHFGTAPINLTGNFRAEFIIGNDGANIMDSGGGLDTLWGRLGNDQYVVHNSGTVIFEGVGEGVDRVSTTANYTLATSLEIETFTTNDHFGTAPINLTGNFRAEFIVGNDGANIIDGGGGADTLWGRAGNDQFMVHDAGTVVQEEVGAGVDRVFAGVSYTLHPAAEVEILTTTDHAGTASIHLTGNSFANFILGNNASNVLAGAGGNDTLGGRGGADKFYFYTALGSSNIDTIEDFVVADNSFWLDSTVFTGMPDGVLASGAFQAGFTAFESDDRILYDKPSGRIFFDPDGGGGIAAIEFAQVTPGTTLVFNSFIIL